MFENKYVSLEKVSVRLNLPQSYIRKQTKAGKIPHLIVGGRLRYQEAEVREALTQIEREKTEAKRSLSNRKPTILGAEGQQR